MIKREDVLFCTFITRGWRRWKSSSGLDAWVVVGASPDMWGHVGSKSAAASAGGHGLMMKSADEMGSDVGGLGRPHNASM